MYKLFNRLDNEINETRVEYVYPYLLRVTIIMLVHINTRTCAFYITVPIFVAPNKYLTSGERCIASNMVK